MWPTKNTRYSTHHCQIEQRSYFCSVVRAWLSWLPLRDFSKVILMSAAPVAFCLEVYRTSCDFVRTLASLQAISTVLRSSDIWKKLRVFSLPCCTSFTYFFKIWIFQNLNILKFSFDGFDVRTIIQKVSVVINAFFCFVYLLVLQSYNILPCVFFAIVRVLNDNQRTFFQYHPSTHVVVAGPDMVVSVDTTKQQSGFLIRFDIPEKPAMESIIHEQTHKI